MTTRSKNPGPKRRDSPAPWLISPIIVGYVDTYTRPSAERSVTRLTVVASGRCALNAFTAWFTSATRSARKSTRLHQLARMSTATPKDEVDRNTYRLFNLEDGVPTDAYPIEDAVAEHYLVPPRAVSVPLRFQRQGIRYDDLSDEEKEQWDTLE